VQGKRVSMKYFEHPDFILDKRNMIQKIGQKLHLIRVSTSLTMFQWASDDLPFLRSSRHKIWTLDAYATDYINAPASQGIKKLDGIRVSLDYVMRCEARISTNRWFGKRRIIISTNEYEIYLVLEYFRSIGICFSRNQCVQKRYISISCSKSNRK